MEVRYKGYGRFLDMGSKKLYFALKLVTMWIYKESKGKNGFRLMMTSDMLFQICWGLSKTPILVQSVFIASLQ